jgi:hypothetical protein
MSNKPEITVFVCKPKLEIKITKNSYKCRPLSRSVCEAKYLIKKLVQQSQFPIACYARKYLPLQTFL